jgi:hypothetical protein
VLSSEPVDPTVRSGADSMRNVASVLLPRGVALHQGRSDSTDRQEDLPIRTCAGRRPFTRNVIGQVLRDARPATRTLTCIVPDGGSSRGASSSAVCVPSRREWTQEPSAAELRPARSGTGRGQPAARPNPFGLDGARCLRTRPLSASLHIVASQNSSRPARTRAGCTTTYLGLTASLRVCAMLRTGQGRAQ